MPKNQPQNHKVEHTCSARVGNSVVNCKYCIHPCTKYGKTKAGRQRFQCKQCRRTSINETVRTKQTNSVDKKIITLLKEGCSIRSIARILKISASTVIRRIQKIGSLIEPPQIRMGQAFEVDELCSYVGRKTSLVWIAYAIDNSTRQVAALNIGARSTLMLSKVIEPLLQHMPVKIHTDKLLHYKSLIPSDVHCTSKFGINHIEHKNLTLRTHLKRLNRRSICFSRSITMLRACLMIYFFG